MYFISPEKNKHTKDEDDIFNPICMFMIKANIVQANVNVGTWL